MNGRSLHATINQSEVGRSQQVGGLWSFQHAIIKDMMSRLA
ncbi:hypothetical protein [Uliginosibacterium sp. TH139]|nr:hypothetical protein [Uliginosibacterium sp. TH139]